MLEAMILPALAQGGYSVTSQVEIGKRLNGRRHFVDAVAEKDGTRCLISLKWQQTGGTAEQKVPFEVISLTEFVRSGEYAKAYVVLGGDGWTLRDFYVGRGLDAQSPSRGCRGGPHSGGFRQQGQPGPTMKPGS